MLKKSIHLPLFMIILFLLPFIGPQAALGQDEANEEAEDAYPSADYFGFLQQQFISDQSSGIPNQFSIARARLGISSGLTDRISVNIMGGFTEPPNNTPRLVNAFIDFDIHPLLQLRTGQLLLPFGLEGPEAIYANPAIERSMAIRGMNDFTMFRDVGMQVSGRRSDLTYAVALVNGMGANRTEQIDPKDVMGRVGLTVSEDLSIGVSGHAGRYRPDNTSSEEESRYRAGLDVSYETGPVFTRAEYQYRQDNLTLADDLQMHGGYVLAGYELSDEVEAIGRYDYFDPDSDLDDDHLTILTTGLNYYFSGHNRLSVNYEFRNNRMNPAMDDLLTVQMQVVL